MAHMIERRLPEEATTGAREVVSPANIVPVIRVSLQSQVDGGRNPKSLALETYVPQDIPVGEMHKILDTMRHLSTRQTAAYEIPLMEEAIKKEEKQVLLAEEQMGRIEAARTTRAEIAQLQGKRNEPRIPENEEQNRVTLLSRMEQSRANIMAYRDILDGLKAIVNDVGLPNSGASN